MTITTLKTLVRSRESQYFGERNYLDADGTVYCLDEAVQLGMKILYGPYKPHMWHLSVDNDGKATYQRIVDLASQTTGVPAIDSEAIFAGFRESQRTETVDPHWNVPLQIFWQAVQKVVSVSASHPFPFH